MSSDVLVRRQGWAGRMTLNRPKAINALTAPMVDSIARALTDWSSDPAVQHVVLDGAGDRGLCAGGDVLSLSQSNAKGSAFAKQFWADEYRLNAQIKRYCKPIVALMDGIVMGGGIGLASHASHRIVTERSVLAMPETGIGLIPDVGGTWLLSHAPGETGTYLGMTGSRMTAADAIFAGFADAFITSSDLPALTLALEAAAPGTINEVMARFTKAPPASGLAALQPKIDALFGGGSAIEIMAALAKDGGEWAVKTHGLLLSKSPKAMAITVVALRTARGLPDLEAALEIEHRLVTRLFEDGEFIEGVRALLVDKDKAPKWRPASIDQITPDLVARYFEPTDIAS